MVTRKRKLRESKSVWEAETGSFPESVRNLDSRIYDVIIIGAGISGALAAEAVSTVTSNILVIDRRLPASGSTAATTALIQWEIDEPLIRLGRKVGAQRARRSYLAAYQGVQNLIHTLRSNGIACDLVRRPSLLLAGNRMGPKALMDETRLRRQIGLPSRMLDGLVLKRRYGINGKAAILSSGNCEVNPRKLTASLLKIAAGRGASFAYPIAVKTMSPTPLGVLLKLADGRVVAARKVIAATGYEVLPEIPKEKYGIISTWAIATQSLPKYLMWKDRALIWEASDPYLYARTTMDGRIVAGGEDEDFSTPSRRAAKIPAKAKAILSKFQKLRPLPELAAEFAWSGSFATSPTGLPVIGEVDRLPNVFAILASGGNGITFSCIAAAMAKSWVKGRTHRHASLFTPDR